LTGFGLETLLDPTNLIGLGLAGKAARGASVAARTAEEAVQGATKANALREAMLAKGAMPRDVAELTLAKDASGNPIRQYHGTRSAFDDVDFGRAGSYDGSTLGPGYYTTPDPRLANTYAGITPENVAYHQDQVAHAMKGFGSREELERHVADANQTINDLWDKQKSLIPKMRELESSPEARDQYLDVFHQVQDFAGRARALEQQTRHQASGVRSLEQLDKMASTPANVRMQYLDIRNPLDLRGTGFGEEKLHPLLADLQAKLGGEAATSDRFLAGLKEAGYDSVIAPHAGTHQNVPQYVVFDKKQIYKPWLAPDPVPVPAGYGGPSPLRAAAAPLGALGAEQMLVNRAPDRNEQYLLSLLGR
jgi:hypothetical protein